jgi:hypothetical protein
MLVYESLQYSSELAPTIFEKRVCAEGGYSCLYVDLGNIFQVLKMDFSRISSWAWAGKLLH